MKILTSLPSYKTGNYNMPENGFPCHMSEQGPGLGNLIAKLRSTVREDRRLLFVDGRVFMACINWIRDHVHEMKAFMHWEQDLKGFIDILLDYQSDEGWFFELIKQIEINIDYILMLVKKYHDSHCDDKEVLVTIRKAIDASPELRSKKALIENFIAGINDVSDVMIEWRQYVAAEKERQLVEIIQEEKLKEAETRKFIEVSFRDGSVKTTGTDIDKLMPPMSRFGGGNRAEKKQGVITKLMQFFERFFGIG